MNGLLQAVVCEEGSRARTPDELLDAISGQGLSVSGTVDLPTGHVLIEVKCD